MIKGYTWVVGNKMIFIKTDASRKTKKVVDAMIEAAGAYRGLCEDWIERFKTDDYSRNRIMKEMQASSLEEKDFDGEKRYMIDGKNFCGAYKPEEIILA